MRARLTLREKNYIVAMFGDVPDGRRAALFRMADMPVIPAVMAAAREIVGYVEKISGPPPKKRKPGPRPRSDLTVS